MINLTLCGILLTTFISMNGQVMEVSASSPEAVAYATEAVTDIGNPDNLESTQSTESTVTAETTATPEPTATPESTVAPQTIIVQDNEEVVALLSEQVELLAENSASVTGTINSTILNFMDRMVDNYPSYYKYAGFRTSNDDSYQTTLYIAKRADVNGSTITFGEDCKAVHFYRTQISSYNNYIYYEVTDTPYASVDVSTDSIVYTNAMENYPSLGTRAQFPSEILWIGIFAFGALILITRRSS